MPLSSHPLVREDIRMANFTRRAIKETFIHLLEERPLNDITVKDIVERCGINRNSFYYHYQDIPALIEEIIKEDAEAIIRAYPSVTTIVDGFDAVIEFAAQHRRAILHIYRSVSWEVFERKLMQVCEYFVGSYADTALAQEPIPPEDRKTIVDYYKCVCFGLTIGWLDSGMSEEYIRSIRFDELKVPTPAAAPRCGTGKGWTGRSWRTGTDG